jgi:type II secretory pathway component GspD/PulD (secretin)
MKIEIFEKNVLFVDYKSILRHFNDKQRCVWRVKHSRNTVYVMNVDDTLII